jgi:tRNA(Ile)-lysidine synthase
VKSAGFSSQWLAGRLAALLPTYPNVSLCVALSGGVDSVALLAAAAALKSRSAADAAGLALRAIHIHHGLHPNADRWARHCGKVAKRLGVRLETVRVKVVRTPGDSLEAAARDARYAALAERLKPAEVLLTAHHQDDQLETVFLQLLRGAGIAGLAAMPEIAPFAHGQLVRPLLTLSRAQLEAWAREEKLEWIEDDTNANEQFDRNFLRRSVLPLIRSRWPGAAGAVSRTARHAAEARRLLDSVARADVERASVGAALSAQGLRALDNDRRRNALRFWITRSGFAAPDTRRLEELAGPVLEARVDAHPEVRWNGTLVSRQGDALWISGDRPAASAGTPADEVIWDWRASPQLELSAFGGTLEISRDPHGPLDLESLPAALCIRPRRGGERLRTSPRGRTRMLKALLQEARIPSAQRARLPLIYSGDRLIAVADRWIDASIGAAASCGHRARFIWRTTK